MVSGCVYARERERREVIHTHIFNAHNNLFDTFVHLFSFWVEVITIIETGILGRGKRMRLSLLSLCQNILARDGDVLIPLSLTLGMKHIRRGEL